MPNFATQNGSISAATTLQTTATKKWKCVKKQAATWWIKRKNGNEELKCITNSSKSKLQLYIKAFKSIENSSDFFCKNSPHFSAKNSSPVFCFNLYQTANNQKIPASRSSLHHTHWFLRSIRTEPPQKNMQNKSQARLVTESNRRSTVSKQIYSERKREKMERPVRRGHRSCKVDVVDEAAAFVAGRPLFFSKHWLIRRFDVVWYTFFSFAFVTRPLALLIDRSVGYYLNSDRSIFVSPNMAAREALLFCIAAAGESRRD